MIIKDIPTKGRVMVDLATMAKHKLSVCKVAALLWLDKEGMMPIGALGNRLGQKPGAMTLMVDQLEDSGLVRCWQGKDRRKRWLELTDAGKAMAARLKGK